MNIHQVSNEIWGIGNDILFNRFEKKDWPNLLLPFILLRRLDLRWQEEYGRWRKKKEQDNAVAEAWDSLNFKNDHAVEVDSLSRKPNDYLLEISKSATQTGASKLRNYIKGFNPDVLQIFEAMGFLDWVEKLHAKDALQPLLSRICDKNRFDFTSASAPPELMSEVFEDMIRQFAEQNNKEAGEHYTPRDAVKLLISLLLNGDVPEPGEPINFYDPTCGTGGILSMGKKAIIERVSKSTPPIITLYGQEMMDLTYGTCKADLLLRGDPYQHVKLGNTLKDDLHPGRTFRYQGANPPYGVSWKILEKEIKEQAGPGGRFPAGTPRTTDGQFLFVQHMVGKMHAKEKGGGRIAVVLNGSPLFAGDAGSGESNIRGWLLKNDLVEAIVRLPNELFFNTGITTYIWVLANNKTGKRKGHVYLIDAADQGRRLAKALGNKRYELDDAAIKEIATWHRSKEENQFVKRIPNTDFAYYSVDIQVPVLDESGEQKTVTKGKKEVSVFENDSERVPYKEIALQTLDHKPSEELHATRDEQLAEVIARMRPDGAPKFTIKAVTLGWEIPFNQLFYKFEEPAHPATILKDIESEIDSLKALFA